MNESKSATLGIAVLDTEAIEEGQDVKPWHQQAAFFAAVGLSQIEIAEKLGKSATDLQALFNYRYFLDLIKDEIFRQGRTVEEVLDGQKVDAILTIMRLQNDPNAPPAVQFACAKEILNRTQGVPSSKAQVQSETKHQDPVAEAERLRNKLETLEERQPKLEKLA